MRLVQGSSTWYGSAGSPTQPITAHQLTEVLITRTCKSFSHSSRSTYKHQYDLTSVSGLVSTLLDSSFSIRCWSLQLCCLPLVSSSVCCPRPPSPSSPCYHPVPVLGFRWLPVPTISWTRETNHPSHLLSSIRSINTPVILLLLFIFHWSH